MKPIKLFIEAYPITEKHISGIGHMTLELIRALEKHPDNKKTFEINLVINRDRRSSLNRWKFKSVYVKTIPLPTRLFNILWKFDLLPPMDIFLGKGAYVFPNYKNWRLLLSKSYTYVCDISYLLFPEYVSPKNQRYLQKNIFKWVKRSCKVLAISKNAQTEIVEHLHIKKDKTLLVPCGVDVDIYYKKSSTEIENFKTKYSLKKNYILYLGNIEPRKNIIRLIGAYKMLPAKLRGQYALVIVGGGGWLNEPIMKEITEAQNAGFNVIKPSVYIPDDDLPTLHSGATILVHPALYEGFGISTLQAMACQTPVIAANNSSMPEVVGDSALLVNAEDASDISVKMETLLKDKGLQQNLMKQGLKQVQRYTWDNAAKALVDGVIGNYGK